MAVQGLRHTGSGSLATDERPKNWRDGILNLFPNGNAPFFSLTARAKNESTDDPEFNWWEKEISAQRVALAEDLDDSETEITLVAGALELKLGDILYVEGGDGELLLVNGNPTVDTSLPSVVRGYAGTAAAAQTYAGAGDNPYLLKVGSCYEEASDRPQSVGYLPTKKYNYTQIFRDNISASRTAQKTRLRTRKLVVEAKKETTHYHAGSIERALLFGARQEETRNGKPARLTDGLLSVLAREAGYDGTTGSNINDLAGAAQDLEAVEDELDKMFRYGSQEKMAFCGNTALLTLQRVVRLNANLELMPTAKEFGLSVRKLISPFGTLALKTHPLFNQVPGGTTGGTAYYGMSSWMVVIDWENVKYRFVDDTFYKPDQQDNGLDGMEAGFITECGLEFQHAKTHYVIKGMAAAQADD